VLRRRLEIQSILSELMLLEKDQDRIYGKIAKRATAGGQESTVVSDTRGEEERRKKSLNPQELNTSYSSRDADKQRVANEKELKRIWAEEVEAEGSRSFFDQTLIKVHWVGGYVVGAGASANPFNTALQFIKSQPKGRVRDEISCFGYAPSQGIDHKPTSVGVIIKGYTTYVSAVDAATHMTSRATDVERRKHSGSGLHKRPLMSLPSIATQNMIVDEESWSSATRQYHEVIVDNWVVGGIIIPSFQQMVDEFKRGISGIGRERQGEVDKKVEEAKRNFQELGRVASETGIPFYDDKLQPFDFSGKEFEAGELESEWDKVISPVDDKVEGRATGDPDVPEIVVEGKEINLVTDGFSKSITLKNCDIRQLELNNLKGGTVRLENCDRTLVGAQFESGEGSIELINPKRNNADIISLRSNFKLRSAKFVGCNFRYQLAGELREQREKNGSIITFENCTGLDEDAESWAEPPDTSPKFYYHGPGASEVKNLSADKIAGLVFKNSGGNHVVHVDGEWKPALGVKDVSDSYRKLIPPVPQQRLPPLPPPPPPPPPPPLSESALRSLIQGILGESSYSRPHSRTSEVKVVSPFMWYEDRLFVVAEYERFVGGPKVKTGFYTSRGESVENTEHMAASWQPCLGINKGDGWIKKLPGKWADPGSLLDMVSGELSKRYDDAWQRQKRAEIFGQLRREKRGMSRSEIGETQIDIINSEFGRHGALFDKSFTNRSLTGDDVDAYYSFAERFSEGALRVIEEDLQSFLDASQDISYSTSGHDPHFTGQDKPLKDKARAVKRLWMQHSDQKGLQRVVDLVHWFSDPRKQIPKFMSLSGNNEISTIMHPKTEELRSSWGGMGVLVKGWITLAANNMNDLMTLYGEKTRAKDMETYRHSGLRKRPSHFYARSAGSYVLGPEDLDDYKFNEAVVANWKPVAWVIPDSFNDYLRNARRSEREEILDAVRASKLPAINGEGEPIGMGELEEMLG
jgi:hypothetical protein